MKHTQKKLPLFLSQKDIENLTRNIRKDHHKLGLYLMSYGGLRVSEMCCLKVSDIHLQRGFMKIKGKGGKERIVPLNATLQRMIETYLGKYSYKLNPESFLIGGDRSSWHYVVKKYSEQNLGRRDVHCHTLRHSFATGLYEKEVPIERISQILGHSKLDTTLIYSRISIEQKKEAVMTLDGPKGRIFSLARSFRKRTDITVRNSGTLIGREKELEQITGLLQQKTSVILSGLKGSGKTAILRPVPDEIFIHEYKTTPTLKKKILSGKQSITSTTVRTGFNPSTDKIYKEAEKQLKKLSIEELLNELKNFNKTIIFDDITGLSKLDRHTISKLSELTPVLAASSRTADKKLFKTFIEIKPLKRHHTRLILSEMVQLTDPRKKELLIDDVLHQSGDNLKEAEYIAHQLTMGKTSEEVITDERESNQKSIAPFLLIFVLFFAAYVLKSYASAMVALSYALLVVFRMVFYKYIFMPASKK
jgi:hypothetical protein